MEYLPAFAIILTIVAIISWRWVKAIDYMKENHPDYKGEDFLNWGENKDENKDENENDKNQIM